MAAAGGKRRTGAGTGAVGTDAVGAGGARMRVEAWTDGSARGNPGPGGYGALLRYVDPAGGVHERELSCGYRRTTNNRMELMGAIAALEALVRPCAVELHTDSQYLANAFTKGWVDSWQRKGWKNASRQPVKNRDLWERLLRAMGPHEVTWLWVKGHAGHADNERADQLATSAADGRDLLEDAGYDG